MMLRGVNVNAPRLVKTRQRPHLRPSSSTGPSDSVSTMLLLRVRLGGFWSISHRPANQTIVTTYSGWGGEDECASALDQQQHDPGIFKIFDCASRSLVLFCRIQPSGNRNFHPYNVSDECFSVWKLKPWTIRQNKYLY
mmetsp:Transcript_20228/g.47540  ORF Transcript_20228/g.47540 Transcript_20228/m.47540 type:complete len:138 (-) Transcript_20228:382-795(-)